MKKHDILGFAGVALITFNSIPSIISALKGQSMPPIASVLLTIMGLACCLYQTIKTENNLYFVANLLGIIGNSILLFAILSH